MIINDRHLPGGGGGGGIYATTELFYCTRVLFLFNSEQPNIAL